jgi:hypothetical protein
MTDLHVVRYACASCGESNETLVDPTGGTRQVYTEDCQVCCRPNLLTITIGEEGEVVIEAAFEE